MLPAAMGGRMLSTRGVFLLLATLAALVSAAGCGSSSSDEVTVQTGSLSKTEFIKKADAICEAARTEFLAKYSRYVEEHKSDIVDPQKKDEVLNDILDSILAPNVEGEIVQISKLGAPKDYAPEVAAFLNALQKRLDKAQENPDGLTTTTNPFVVAENVARRAAMNGCAGSFS